MASPLLAMLIFVAAEAILVAGLVSAYLIARTGAPAWPPLWQPRLPVAVTGVNTLVLLASGAMMLGASRAWTAPGPSLRTRRALGVAILLGAIFVLVQGVEWVRLISAGLTVRSSAYGSFFYLLVGTHALHAVAALIALGWAAWRVRRGALGREAFEAVGVFWAFVVLVWPVLYGLVYLW